MHEIKGSLRIRTCFRPAFHAVLKRYASLLLSEDRLREAKELLNEAGRARVRTASAGDPGGSSEHGSALEVGAVSQTGASGEGEKS